jgi:hypothetical protein
MHLLDISAPKNSIIIISDWSLIIQYYYYRIVENFRPDLVVLNYDIKFNNYKILPLLYPAFYKSIQKEYDDFVQILGKEHPHQIVNTGCNLNTPALMSAYRNLINKIEDVARSGNKYFLTDSRANLFYTENNYYSPKKFVSGCFSSSMPGDSIANNYFLNMDFPFLNSPILLTDPSAINTIIGYRATTEKYLEYYSALKDSNYVSKSLFAYDKANNIKIIMRRNLPYTFD